MSSYFLTKTIKLSSPSPKSESPNPSQRTWGDTKIPWATTHHQQLLTMKECSREKVLKGKKSQYDPPYPSRWSVGPGGQRDQEHGVVLHVQGECYQPPITFRSGSSHLPQGFAMTLSTHPGGPGGHGQQDQGRSWGSST